MHEFVVTFVFFMVVSGAGLILGKGGRPKGRKDVGWRIAAAFLSGIVLAFAVQAGFWILRGLGVL